MEPGTVLFLLAAGFVAAFIDSIVGGGGALSIPALLAAGLPPHLALGTNKLAATGASLTASTRYVRAGLVERRTVLLLGPLSGLAAVVGALLVLEVDPLIVETLVIGVMGGMVAYVLLRRSFGLEDRTRPLVGGVLAGLVTLTLAIGLYDGFLGPGTGSFFIFALVGVRGFDFLRAAANARVLNFCSNAGSLALFLWAGEVAFLAGVTMMAGMLVGAWTGSQVGIRTGARWIKPLFVLVTLGLMARLLLA